MFKNFIKGALIYGGINIIQKSISIFLVPLYLMQLSSNQYGQLEISLAIYAFISHLFMFQLEAGFQRFFYENDSNAKSRKLFFSNHIFLGILTTSIGAVLYILLYDKIILHIYGNVLIPKIIFILIGLDIISRSSTTLMLIALRFKDNKFSFGVSAITDTFVTAFFAIVLLSYYNFGLIGVFIAQLCGSFISNLYMIFILKEDLIFNLNLKILKPSLKYSIFLVPGVMIGWSFTHFSRIFMSTAGIELNQIGIYGLAFKFSIFIIVAVNALKLVWQPTSIKLINKKGSRKFYAKIFDYYTSALLIISIVLTISMKSIISIIAPTEYLSAFYYGPGLLAATILNCSTMILGMGIVISKKTIYTTIITSIGAICNLLIMVYGIESYGINAVTFAYFFSSLIVALLTFLFSQFLYFIPYKNFSHFSLIIGSILISVYPLANNIYSGIYYQSFIIVIIFLLSTLTIGKNEIKNILQKLNFLKK